MSRSMTMGAFGCAALLAGPPLLLLALCSGPSQRSNTSASPRPRPGNVDLAGSAVEAKRSGFRDCTVGDSLIWCRRGRLTLLGGAVDHAVVELGDSHQQGKRIDPARAWYNGVKLGFASEAAERAFTDGLERRGWIADGLGNWWHAGLPLHLYRDDMSYTPEKLTIAAASLAEADDNAGRIAAERNAARRPTADDRRRVFSDWMKR